MADRMATQVTVMSSSDLTSAPKETYSLQTALYLSKGSLVTRAGFDRYGCLSIVGDEARCTNTQVMAVFVSAPIEVDKSAGFVAPLQMNPDLHLDLEEKSLPVRIAEAYDNGSHTLRSDDLVSTWHCCRCLDSALKNSFGNDFGLMVFHADDWLRPGLQHQPALR